MCVLCWHFLSAHSLYFLYDGYLWLIWPLHFLFWSPQIHLILPLSPWIHLILSLSYVQVFIAKISQSFLISIPLNSPCLYLNLFVLLSISLICSCVGQCTDLQYLFSEPFKCQVRLICIFWRSRCDQINSNANYQMHSALFWSELTFSSRMSFTSLCVSGCTVLGASMSNNYYAR